MGLVKRQFGASAKMESINKVVSDALNKYIQDNKINMLGRPMPSEKQTPIDLDKGGSLYLHVRHRRGS